MLSDIDRIIVVGAGKAGTPMAAAVFEVLGERVTTGAVNGKTGHMQAAGGWEVRFSQARTVVARDARANIGPITLHEAGHPVPDAAGQAGAEHILELLAGLSARDLVIAVISGGGSALLPLPVAGISLADYQSLTTLLLQSGATIDEVNAVRKHCSRLQGGQLARSAAPAQVAALILSDVIGSPLETIASGPTVPDSGTFSLAWNVLKKYGLTDSVSAGVRGHLLRGLLGETAETPKPGDPLFERVHNVVVGDNAIAGRAAVEAAKELGYQALLVTTFLQGEAREAGKVIAGVAQGIATGQSDYPPATCLVFGGETTVTVRGPGLGGRNQELALSAAITLAERDLPPEREIAVVSLGTDGTDGPTDAAGGAAFRDSLLRARAAGLEAERALAANDSYRLLAGLGDLLFTGPTQTNVNDLVLVFVR